MLFKTLATLALALGAVSVSAAPTPENETTIPASALDSDPVKRAGWGGGDMCSNRKSCGPACIENHQQCCSFSGSRGRKCHSAASAWIGI